MRICLYGGPGVGKSSMAAALFAQMKSDNIEVELVTEYVKTWTYVNRVPRSYDQFYLLAQQLHREDIVLRAGFSHLITDCPLPMICFYSQKNFMTSDYEPSFRKIVKDFECMHPSMHFLIKRKEGPFSKIGRHHTEEEALVIDKELEEYLRTHWGSNLDFIDAGDNDKLYNVVIKRLENAN